MAGKCWENRECHGECAIQRWDANKKRTKDACCASGVTYKYKMTKENPVYSPHIIIISRVLLFWGFWVRGPPGPR